MAASATALFIQPGCYGRTPVKPEKPSESAPRQRVIRAIRPEETQPEPGAPPPRGTQETDLRTQNERDQSSDAAGNAPRPVIEQAKRDIDAGLVDTDLHGTPGMGAERQRELLEREKKRSEPKKDDSPG